MIKKSLILLSLFAFGHADTVEFNNGAMLDGKVTKQTDSTLSIKMGGATTTYSQADIKKVSLDSTVSAPPPAPVSAAPKPQSSSKDMILKAGSEIHISMMETVSTASHRRGHQFKMRLESDLRGENNQVLVKKGSTLYAVVVDSQQAGRLIGESKMLVSITAISVEGKRVSVSTNSLNILTAHKQGRDTVGKMAKGAAIGGLINGSDGAKDGAKVGVGLAILTRGKPSGVQAGTLLTFRLTADTKIN